jgi:GAF domain-containing protein
VDKLLGSVIEIIGASDGSFSYLDPAAGELVFLTVHGALRTQLTGYRLKSDVGVAGWAVQEGQPVIVNNPRQDWRFSLEIDQQFSFNTRSILCMPVKHKHRALGAIQILNKRHNNFNQTDTLLASVLANVAATALAKMEPAAIAPLLLSPPQPPLW